jgi:hypothetical protein
VADEGQESPQSRLLAAGFSRRLDWWVTPDGAQVLGLDDAIAGLDNGEILPMRQLAALPNRPCPPPQPQPLKGIPERQGNANESDPRAFFIGGLRRSIERASTKTLVPCSGPRRPSGPR